MDLNIKTLTGIKLHEFKKRIICCYNLMVSCCTYYPWGSESFINNAIRNFVLLTALTPLWAIGAFFLQVFHSSKQSDVIKKLNVYEP